MFTFGSIREIEFIFQDNFEEVNVDVGKKAVYSFMGGFGNGFGTSLLTIFYPEGSVELNLDYACFRHFYPQSSSEKGRKSYTEPAGQRRSFPAPLIYISKIYFESHFPMGPFVHPPNYCDKECSSDTATVNSSQMLSFRVKLCSEEQQPGDVP